MKETQYMFAKNLSFYKNVLFPAQVHCKQKIKNTISQEKQRNSNLKVTPQSSQPHQTFVTKTQRSSCMAVLKGKGAVWADPAHRLCVCPMQVWYPSTGLCSGLLWPPLTVTQGEAVSPTQTPAFPAIWASVSWILTWQSCALQKLLD